MKKFLAILMTVAMMVSCMVGFALTSSAAPEWVHETYKFEDVKDDFGTQAVDENGALEEELLLGDFWTYEYYDVAEEEFIGMSAYFAESLESEGWQMGGWSDVYMPMVESAWTGGTDVTWYCAVSEGGKRFHPGAGANPVVTFTVPATGVISYSASVYSYNEYGVDKGTPQDGVNTLYAAIFVNDEKVWPEEDDDGRFSAATVSSDSPFMIDVAAFSVTEGDQVRLMLGLSPGNTSFGGAGMNLVDYPVITYNEAEVAIGDPNGTPPEGISTSDRTAEGCVASWSEARNAKGYNIYVDGEKINSELVTELTYTITGLEPSSTYELTITTVTNDGKESVPSEAVAFRTAKGEKKTDTSSDTATGDTSAPAGTDTPVAPSDVKDGDGNSTLWIIIAIAAAVVVIAVVVVLVLVLGKKKAAPAVEAAPEAAPAVDAAPEAAAPAEEAPADEEKKD